VATISTSRHYGLALDNKLPGLGSTALGQVLDDAVAVGVGWIRLDLAWNNIQPNSPASYSWSSFDRVVAAANTRHLSLLPELAYTPSWAWPAGCANVKCHPADPNQFATFAAAAVARYAPQGIHSWEIWNEPNAGYYWQPAADVGQYVSLLQSAVPAIKAADPSATVISGGLAPKSTGGGDIGQLDWLPAFCSQGGIKVVDAVGYHPYSGQVPTGYNAKWNPWNQISTTSTSFRSILDSCGYPTMKVWATEYGATTIGPGPMATTDNLLLGATPKPDHVSESLQAQDATDSVFLTNGSPTIAAMFWYSNIDSQGTSRGSGYGLRHLDGTPKPSYAALQQALAQVH
jgi:hypothetical protein